MSASGTAAMSAMLFAGGFAAGADVPRRGPFEDDDDDDVRPIGDPDDDDDVEDDDDEDDDDDEEPMQCATLKPG